MLFPNANHRLATMVIRVQADNFDNAIEFAHDIVSSLLSMWSFNYDVAIDILGYQIVEEMTGAHRWSLNVLGQEKMYDAAQGTIPNREHRAVLAAYREAANATNPFYQFLRFYRVIEGVRNLRNQQKLKAAQNNKEYRQPSERIPLTIDELPEVHRESASSFAPYLGKKFLDVIDKAFRNDLRNAVTHLDPTKDDLVVDRYADVERVRQIMPVIRYISREMLKNELSFTTDDQREEMIS